MATFITLSPWILVLRGVVGILFGLIAFFMPGVTLFVLTTLFGAYVLIDGVISLVTAVQSARHGQPWGHYLLEGLACLAAAAVTMIWPAITLTALVYIIAAWAVVTGVFEIVAAVRLRRVIRGEWLLILAGVASILFGCAMFAAPVIGAVVLAWWIGAYAFVFGILLLSLAFRMRRLSATMLTPHHA